MKKLLSYKYVESMPCDNADQAIEKLLATEQLSGMDEPHIMADMVLKELLIALGYSDVVEVYNKLDISFSYSYDERDDE